MLDGHEVLANNSRWVSFTTVRNERWFHDNVVLLGDAAHTAHFSIGSGTKLAMEDALSLAACLHESPDLKDALAAYEQERKAVVISTQRAAQASLEWFENLGQYTHQHPMQFAFNILTRSRRITYDNLRLRDPEFIARVDEWFADVSAGGRARHGGDRARRCSLRSGSGSSTWPTGSSSHPWTCTSHRTACPATSTSSTSAARHSVVPAS